VSAGDCEIVDCCRWSGCAAAGGGVIIAVVANLLQVGLFFSGKRIQPNFEVLNPLRGLGKLFQGESFVHLTINLLKLLLVGVLAWSAITQRMNEIVIIQQLSYMQAFTLGATIVYAVGLRVAVLLLVLAIIDYTYHKLKTERELRMTKQEIKEEMRRMEGDPKIKQRRRQIAYQMATKRLAKDVPTADVIITNPTHFAIALKYDANSMHAPKWSPRARTCWPSGFARSRSRMAFRSSSASRWRGRCIGWLKWARRFPSNFIRRWPRFWLMSTS